MLMKAMDMSILFIVLVNVDKGIYYYTTYENSQITAIDMHQENLDSSRLIRYPLQKEWNVLYQNR